MADPKTPFWKRFTVTKTKNPISSTKPPARPVIVVAPTVEGLEKKEWIEKQRRIQIKKMGSFRASPGDMDKFFKTAWEKEQGTYKRLKPKRKPINYNTMKETSKWMNTKPTKQNFWQRRAANTKFNPKTGIKLLKIGKSLTPLGLGGTALWYAASKAYDPERVKKSKTQWGIK